MHKNIVAFVKSFCKNTQKTDRGEASSPIAHLLVRFGMLVCNVHALLFKFKTDHR